MVAHNENNQYAEVKCIDTQYEKTVEFVEGSKCLPCLFAVILANLCVKKMKISVQKPEKKKINDIKQKQAW